MGNACFAPANEAADDEAADDEAEPPEQEDFVTLTGGAKRGTFHVGAEAVRRDGGETSGIGWKRGFVTSLKPELRVTATCADPHARGFSWCASPSPRPHAALAVLTYARAWATGRRS